VYKCSSPFTEHQGEKQNCNRYDSSQQPLWALFITASMLCAIVGMNGPRTSYHRPACALTTTAQLKCQCLRSRSWTKPQSNDKSLFLTLSGLLQEPVKRHGGWHITWSFVLSVSTNMEYFNTMPDSINPTSLAFYPQGTVYGASEMW